MGRSRKKSFWDVLRERICDLEAVVRSAFALSLALFVLLLVSLTMVDPSSATFVIVVLDLVGIAVIGVTMGALLYVCGFER